MSDMPSAREHGLYDLRRKRAGAAAGVVLAATVLAMFVTFQTALLALPAAALFAFLALPSWVGTEARFPVQPAWRAVGEYLLSFGVPMVGVMTMYVVLNKGEPAIMALIPFAVIGAVCYAVYRWRYQDMALKRVRGERAGMPLLQRLWRHYLGYGAGLSAGFLAAFAARDLVAVDNGIILAEAVFAGAFLLAKSVVDISLPQPPLPATRLSVAALQLTVMSPVWFGLPWGAFFLGMLTRSLPDVPLPAAIEANTDIVVFTTIAAFVVFAAISLVAFIIEAATGEG